MDKELREKRQAKLDEQMYFDRVYRAASRNQNIGSPLSSIIKATAQYGSNAYENPNLYSAYGLKYGGDSPEGGRGMVRPMDPEWTYAEFNTVTPPHEGTHAKYAMHVKRTSKLPTGSIELYDENTKRFDKFPTKLRNRVRELLRKDPNFWEWYTDSPVYVPENKDPGYWNYATSGPEVAARLNAIEARMPKGKMLERTQIASELFPTTKDLEDYLAYVNPEGYVINNPTFTPLENGILSKLKRLFK